MKFFILVCLGCCILWYSCNHFLSVSVCLCKWEWMNEWLIRFLAQSHTPPYFPFALISLSSFLSRSVRLPSSQVLREITHLVCSAFMLWPNSFFPSPSPLYCFKFFHFSFPLYHSSLPFRPVCLLHFSLLAPRGLLSLAVFAIPPILHHPAFSCD